MLSIIQKIKGIHPGIFLEHELKRRGIRKADLALAINEYPQTIVAIIKGRRSMNLKLAVKIESELGLEEGLLMVLQVFFDIEQLKPKMFRHANLPNIRKVLFWDTDFDKIDWIKQEKAIVKRVFSHGNEQEQQEIRAFYGTEKVEQILNEASLRSKTRNS